MLIGFFLTATCERWPVAHMSAASIAVAFYDATLLVEYFALSANLCFSKSAAQLANWAGATLNARLCDLASSSSVAIAQGTNSFRIAASNAGSCSLPFDSFVVTKS